jgi:predicted amidohydrolase YtcJ
VTRTAPMAAAHGRMETLLIRDVEVDGRAGLDVRLRDGLIAEIGQRLAPGGAEVDGGGGALLPGLADHHIHLMALAAQADSVPLAGLAPPELAVRLIAATSARPRGAWVRATGYHEGREPLLDRDVLDMLAPHHPVRVQHRSGALWVLNSLALRQVLTADPPPCVERDPDGRASGRIWRGDAWLSERIGRAPPPLGPVGAQLSRLGITAVTDASATTDAGSASLMAAAVRSGELPLRVTLMSRGPLAAPADGAFRVGPVKLLLDEEDLPDFETVLQVIGQARAWGRAVAVHCVTATELAFALAALETAGAAPGDRLEHGGVIPEEAIAAVAALGLTVVTQPAFIHAHGDRYLAEVAAEDIAGLYRCARLKQAGVPVAGSSDAPYVAPDPWAGMRAAVSRRTASGAPLGPDERLPASGALGLYLGAPERPGGAARRVEAGAPADLCLMSAPLRVVLGELQAELVSATFVAGRPVYGPAFGWAAAA